MLSIEQKTTNEIQEHGVGISLIVDKTEPDASLFQNEQNLHIVEAMFNNNDATHAKIVEIVNAVDKCTTTYDKNLVSAIFDEIVALDQQSYADIMTIIKAILIGINDKAFTITANSIKHIVSTENSVEKDTVEEAVEAEEDKNEEKETPKDKE